MSGGADPGPEGAELRLSTIAGLIAGMALATLGFYEPLPPWVPLPLCAIALWRLWWPWHALVTPRVRQATKLAVLAALALALWASGRLGIGIDGAGAIYILLLWTKLLELHSARDFHRTASIALFVVAAQLLLSQTLGQCLFAICSSFTLMAVLAQSYIVGAAGSGFADARPWRTWVRAARAAGAIGLQALPFACVVFICVPRPPSPGFDRPVATSGVSDSLAPGSVAKVALSATPAFRVDFSGPAPSPTQCYWRGVILWQTDGETWGRGQSPRLSQPVDPLAASGDEIAYEVTLQPHNQRWIYSLDSPSGEMVGSNLQLSPRAGAVFEAQQRVTVTRLYKGTSLVGGSALDHPAIMGTVRRDPRNASDIESAYLHIADRERLDQRIVDLAASLAARARRDGRVDRERAIDATLDWFRANGFVYTLEPGEMGPDPTATFLFDRRRGFCEHYANAFGLLMRLMGIESRVVVGYYGGEINQVGGFMTVRQANAHAWNEVWTGTRWRRVDPTEAAAALDAQGNPIAQADTADPAAFASARGGGWAERHLRWARQRWDYLEAQWDRWALAYDQDTLAALERQLGLENLGLLAPLLMLVGACLPLAMLVMLAMRWRRRVGDPALAVYVAFCERLARAGVARAPTEGPLDLARRAGAALPAERESIQLIATSYAELRYGPPLRPAERRAGIARLSRQVRAFRPRGRVP